MHWGLVETNIKTTGELLVALLQSDVIMMKDKALLVKKYNVISITEALETAA